MKKHFAQAAREAQNPDNAIELRQLSKTYDAQGRSPAKRALIDVDLDVPRGSFFALLGPNGAGKSTLINILAGLVVKSGGQARVWGYDIDSNPRRAKACIGVVPQELNLDAFFTPREVVEMQAGLYGVPKGQRQTDRILAAVGLTDKAESYARNLSGGMRRRLLVAKAMVHEPPVLILDEPTAGVDIELRQQLWDYVRGLNEAGVTIVLTTHYLEEAETLCDRIAIINHGQVVACEDKRDLLGRLDRKGLVLTVDRDIAGIAELPESLRRYNPEIRGSRQIAVSYSPSRIRVQDILSTIGEAGLTITDLSTEEADLEDVFLSLTSGAHEGGSNAA